MSKLIVTLLLFGNLHLVIAQENVFEASRTGNISQLKSLIEKNGDTINSIDENGFSPLILATYRNQKECVDFLIINGADINYFSPEGSALHASCYRGNLAISSLLILNNLSVNKLNSRGTTCLIYAIQSGNKELVELLLLHGADKLCKDVNGTLPIEYARQSNNAELIELLSQ